MAGDDPWFDLSSSSFATIKDVFNSSAASRRSETALMAGALLLTKYEVQLKSNEVWEVLEKVALAAAECCHQAWFDYCILRLKKRFPGSTRVRRIEVLRHEADGEFGRAEEVVTKLLETKPCDLWSRRRMVALRKSQKNLVNCVDLLNKHLEEFATDATAWQELGAIYAQQMLLPKALHCFEETLLYGENVSSHSLLMVAQLHFSMGAVDVSRKYFCAACHIEESPRSLWGILMSNGSPTPKKRGNRPRSEGRKSDKSISDRKDEADDTADDLLKTASQRLTNLYPDSPKNVVTSTSVALRVLRGLVGDSGSGD